MPTIALPHRTSITSRTSVVQLEYTSDAGPLPKPTDGHWTRFVLLSDTHTKRCEVPDGDVLLHSGDLTQRGTTKELKETMEWLYALPHRVKIIMAGNHDSVIHREWYEKNWNHIFMHRSAGAPEPAEPVHDLLRGPRAVAANIVYLEDEVHRFKVRDGGREWSVFGSPWSPYWGDWAFGYERVDGQALLSNIPQTDILLTHGPPRNILDFTNGKDRAGCSALAARVPELKPKLHVFGHIHEARGAHVHRWREGAEPLSVQNAIQLGVENTKRANKDFRDDKPKDADSGSDVDNGFVLLDEDGDDEMSDGESGSVVDNKIIFLDESAQETPDGDEGEQTIFVNAANYPSGPTVRLQNPMRKLGGPGFQPIIVDMLE
ncbi:Metallo-dependent phosphatase-like protein [Mycena vitilis]|nr:Metallo-dependent phosphatase-like protein [Mycena vitilis]